MEMRWSILIHTFFSYAIEETWFNKEEGEEDQHFNTTHIPLDVEVDFRGYLPNYHISTFCKLAKEICSKPFSFLSLHLWSVTQSKCNIVHLVVIDL